MHLRQRVMDPHRKDDITEALLKATGMVKEGVETPPQPGYAVPWYPPGLRDRTLGPHSKQLVPITRYYPTLNPPVAIDFEPAPPDKWFHDEKLKLCCERGIVYIPLALNDKLTEEQFIVRYKDARHLLDRSEAVQKEVATQEQALEKMSYTDPLVYVEQQLESNEQLRFACQRLGIERAEIERDRLDRPFGGAILRRKIGQHTATVYEQVRRRLKNGVAPAECIRELTDESQRLADGQVHSPVPG